MYACIIVELADFLVSVRQRPLEHQPYLEGKAVIVVGTTVKKNLIRKRFPFLFGEEKADIRALDKRHPRRPLGVGSCLEFFAGYDG